MALMALAVAASFVGVGVGTRNSCLIAVKEGIVDFVDIEDEVSTGFVQGTISQTVLRGVAIEREMNRIYIVRNSGDIILIDPCLVAQEKEIDQGDAADVTINGGTIDEVLNCCAYEASSDVLYAASNGAQRMYAVQMDPDSPLQGTLLWDRSTSPRGFYGMELLGTDADRMVCYGTLGESGYAEIDYLAGVDPVVSSALSWNEDGNPASFDTWRYWDSDTDEEVIENDFILTEDMYLVNTVDGSVDTSFITANGFFSYNGITLIAGKCEDMCVATLAPSMKPTRSPTDLPTRSTPAPSSVTAAPSESTPSPSEVTGHPTVSTPAPTDSTGAPSEASASPTVSTPSPTDSTGAPSAGTASPSSSPSASPSTSPTGASSSPTLSCPCDCTSDYCDYVFHQGSGSKGSSSKRSSSSGRSSNWGGSKGSKGSSSKRTSSKRSSSSGRSSKWASSKGSKSSSSKKGSGGRRLRRLMGQGRGSGSKRSSSSRRRRRASQWGGMGNDKACSASLNLDILVDPFSCADSSCGEVVCEDCGDQRACVDLCRDWLYANGLFECKAFRGKWCRDECARVDGKYKCFFDCPSAPACPEEPDNEGSASKGSKGCGGSSSG